MRACFILVFLSFVCIITAIFNHHRVSETKLASGCEDKLMSRREDTIFVVETLKIFFL